MKSFRQQVAVITRSSFFVNSFWGIFSNIIQNILFSGFFIILARVYSKMDFANYIIANSLYGMLVALSSLGLGQWFIREVISVLDKKQFTHQYFKLQLLLGILFYLLHIGVAFTLYSDQLIRDLSLLLGINIVFDNIIYVIKHINIAEENQRKTFLILTLEATLKFFTGCLLLFTVIPILYLLIVLIFLRLVTLNLFLHYGTSGSLSLKSILRAKANWPSAVRVIRQNLPFVIIGSLSVIYWRIGNVFVSKFLAMDDVADYEVSFKLFSIAEILPFIVSTSLFPILVKASKNGAGSANIIFKQFFYLYALYGLMAYTFIISYSNYILPFLFGTAYVDTSMYCNEMFLAILVFPTALLQANLLVSLKLEKIDMWLNLVSLVLHIIFSLIGIYYFSSLSVICYSIFSSFFIFHLLQDYILVRKGILSLSHCLSFYLGSILCLFIYYLFSIWVEANILFPIFWSIVFILIGYGLYFLDKKNIYKIRVSFSV
ncbi:MAG: oligosaccharide flippase family protein [bacterium]